MKRKYEDDISFEMNKKFKIDKKRYFVEENEIIYKKQCIESKHLENENLELKQIVNQLNQEIDILKYKIHLLQDENEFLKRVDIKQYGLYPFA